MTETTGRTVQEPTPRSDRDRWIALVVLCAGFLMIILDQTIVNVALPSIRTDLGFSQSSLAWVVNAYLIAFGGLLLLAGRLGDLLGRRRIFLVGLTVFTADLTSDSRWPQAVAGCDYVIHVASPLSDSARKTDTEVIAAARDGSLRVLHAARDAKVKRVVMTSSCGAVYYGYPPRTEPFDETNWSNPDRGDMSAYVKSKLIAERAAWDFIKAEGGGLEFAVINPAGIFGPVLGPDASSSTQMVKRLLTGMPGCPRIHFAVVDVRDVADLHLRAMTSPATPHAPMIRRSHPRNPLPCGRKNAASMAWTKW